MTSGTPPEDALHDASEKLKHELYDAMSRLPPEEDVLERGFVRACQMLEIAAVKEQMARLQRQVSQVPDPNNLSEEVVEMMSQRGRLKERLQQLEIALKKPA